MVSKYQDQEFITEVKSVKLKTNITCAGCLNTVTPFLQKIKGLENWSVDLQDPSRTLTATMDDTISAEDIRNALAAAGYVSEAITH